MSGGSSTVHEIAEETKEAGPEIPIEVSFRIIKQFSLELYDNPRRAIEELVCNSYDAGATKCYISVPEDTSDDVKVLDNGESMDLEGLEWLWKVAESRKVEELGEKRIEHDRQQIGKFGVGKLASFALGDRLTHMATVDDTTRVISVHQNDLRGSRDREPFGVREYDVDEAREIFQPVIEDVPDPWEKDWDSWTLAIISDIPPENTGKDLQPWHLHRMIPSAVPSRADFTAYIEGEELETQDPPADVEFEVDLTVDEYIETLERQLRSDWAEELNVDTEDVSEDLYTVSKTTFEDPGDTSEVVAGLQVPKLGNVHGQIEFFDRKLTTGKREERDYDEHGFRVYVRGRLLNKNDISFGLENLSHRYWIRFRSEVEIPALDKELRVTRDSTQDSVELNVAKSVVRATFNTARSRADDEDLFGTTDKEEVTISLDVPFSDRLELRSPWYADQALDGLRTEDGPDFDLSDVEIEPQPLKPTEKAIEFYEEEAKFVVNSNHPLFDTLDQKTHFTQNFEDAFKEILTGRLLIHGYLRYHGAEPDALAASRQIFDAVLRSAAGSIGQDELKYQLQELHDASTEGGDRFEKAIVDIFQNIGLAAAQVGGPDEHDGWVEIPRWGQPNYRFSIEAKGSQGIVTHDDLSFDDVNPTSGSL